MGFGSTAKKVQKMADTAEKLYAKLNELREQVNEMRGTVETMSDRVETLEAENAEQRALIEALAEEEGIDVDDVVADVEAPDVEESGAGESNTEESGAGESDAPAAND